MVTSPTIKSAKARLLMRWLKGQLRFLLGSIATARINRMLPGIFGIKNKMEIAVEKNDRDFGAPLNSQTVSNLS